MELGLDDFAGTVWFASEMKALKDDCERLEVFPPGHIYSSKAGWWFLVLACHFGCQFWFFCVITCHLSSWMKTVNLIIGSLILLATGGLRRYYNPQWFSETFVPETPYQPLELRSAFEKVWNPQKIYWKGHWQLNFSFRTGFNLCVTDPAGCGKEAHDRRPLRCAPFRRLGFFLGGISGSPTSCRNQSCQNLGQRAPLLLCWPWGAHIIFKTSLCCWKFSSPSSFHLPTQRDFCFLSPILWNRRLMLRCDLQGSPDLKAAREVAKYIGTRHHEFNFTVQVSTSSTP